MSTIATGRRLYTVTMTNIQQPSVSFELTLAEPCNASDAEYQARNYAQGQGYSRLGWHLTIQVSD